MDQSIKRIEKPFLRRTTITRNGPCRPWPWECFCANEHAYGSTATAAYRMWQFAKAMKKEEKFLNKN